MKAAFRPSHADFTYQAKFGIRDPNGGGRSSARETIGRVAAGAFAKKILATRGVEARAYITRIHDIAAPAEALFDFPTLEAVEATAVRCPHAATAEAMQHPQAGYFWAQLARLASRAGDDVLRAQAATKTSLLAPGLKRAQLDGALASIEAGDAASAKGLLDLLRGQRKLVNKYWNDANVQVTDFTSEGVVASASWPFQVNTLVGQKQPIASTLPAEGMTGWADTTMLHAKAKHPNCAYMWIEHSLKPKTQGDVAAWFGSVPVVPAACTAFTQALKPMKAASIGSLVTRLSSLMYLCQSEMNFLLIGVSTDSK
jgi:hypothetical protein